MSMYNLSVVLNNQLKSKEAEHISMETLAWRKDVLGTDHPDTLLSIDIVADIKRRRLLAEKP